MVSELWMVMFVTTWGELLENKTNTEEERGKKWKETLLGSCQMTLGFVDEISPQIPSSCA